MNTEFFIVRRIISMQRKERNFSRSMTAIAAFGIALGLAVMIVAVAIITGFKKEISGKVTGFGAHIQVVNLDTNQSYETTPVPSRLEEHEALATIEGVKNIQAFALKAGIIKTGEEIHGAVLKGVDPRYDWSFIMRHLVDGKLPELSDTTRSREVVLSRQAASQLKLGVGDRFSMYFIQDPPRAMTFTISGIYSTSLEEFDRLFIYADIQQVQRLNNWNREQVSGHEILLEDMKYLSTATEKVRDLVAFDFLPDGSRLRVESIKEKYTQIFDWLQLQDMNVVVLIILMLVVAAFNMISGLLILILERTNMIGILKALGASNQTIRRIFLYQSSWLTLNGLVFGNIIGVGICLLQMHFQLIPLDPSSYYLDTVPINLSFLHIILLNVGTMIITYLFLIIPSMIISRISPERSIRFE